MATTINGLPYYEVCFTPEGTLDTETGDGDGGLTAAVATGGIDDLFVFSHGWNNGLISARNLYQEMFTILAEQLGGHLARSAAVGVIWPSLLFPDDDPATAPPVPSTGADVAAALAPAFPDRQGELAAMGQLLDEAPKDPDKLTEFHALARNLVTTPPQGDEDAGESALVDADAVTALGHAAAMAPAEDRDAQGVSDVFSGLWRGAREVLRTFSYYEMKNRAGVVGKEGLAPLLSRLRGPAGPPRIHLIGHSFGARLVSYALAGLPDTAIGAASPVKSLTLIQGAFSHFAFATSLPFDRGRAGALTRMQARVDGPLLATFTAADTALGRWYPAASMLARQDAQGAEERQYRWGAMGHDGYQNDPPAGVHPLLDTGKPYDFEAGRFYALDANSVIGEIQSPVSGAHSDIRHPEVLWAITSAARLGH